MIPAIKELLKCANITSEKACRETQAGTVRDGMHALTGGYVQGVKLKPSQIGVEPIDGLGMYWIFEYKEVAK